MKLRATVLFMAVLMLLSTAFSSCGSDDGGDHGTTATQTTAAPSVGFVDPNYPLMDLLSADLTQYVKVPELSSLKIQYKVYVDDEALEKKLS